MAGRTGGFTHLTRNIRHTRVPIHSVSGTSFTPRVPDNCYSMLNVFVIIDNRPSHFGSKSSLQHTAP